MNDADKLRQTLADLHQELGAVEVKDPEVREMLIRTLREISERLQAEPAGALVPVEGDPAAQLRAAARQFEVDHPALASTLESLVDALARMGI